jgi:hypothetical protein
VLVVLVLVVIAVATIAAPIHPPTPHPTPPHPTPPHPTPPHPPLPSLATQHTRHSTATARSEARYGALLAPYLSDPANLFIISSDFCHWGSRFRYTYTNAEQVRARVRAYDRQCSGGSASGGGCVHAWRVGAGGACRRPANRRVSHTCVTSLCNQGPIWKSIQWLDQLGMSIIEKV